MKTNRTTTIRRLAIIVGTIWMTAQGAAQAETAAVAQPQVATSANAKPAEQPRVILASNSCTRVGNRMVC